MSLIFEAPLSQLSFGQISYNILREFWKKDVELGYFPIGNVDLTCFQPKKEFVAYLQESINRRYDLLKRDTQVLKLWHLNGSDVLRATSQTLLTCQETDSPTSLELTISALQKKTLFLGDYSKEVFQQAGAKNVDSFYCGLDEDFHIVERKYLEDTLHFGLIGKLERRKNTQNIIRAWVKKYGNNKKYALTCCITNPFFSPEDNQKLVNDCFGGQRVWNCNLLPVLKTNEEMNILYNSLDIDLSGASFSESWGIPSFTATCLGKWSVVTNFGGHKSWATQENSILLEPDGLMDSADGVFFQKGGQFNQGNFCSYSEEKLISAMELAERKVGEGNVNGIKLQKKTYCEVLENILKKME